MPVGSCLVRVVSSHLKKVPQSPGIRKLVSNMIRHERAPQEHPRRGEKSISVAQVRGEGARDCQIIRARVSYHTGTTTVDYGDVSKGNISSQLGPQGEAEWMHRWLGGR